MGSGKFLSFDSPYKKDVADRLRKIAHRHNLWQVFRDFVALAALAFSVAADPSTAKEREEEYMRTIKGYTREELQAFSECLGSLTLAMEAEPQDFLGSLYMQLELGNAWKGQFFTPFHLCKLMAAMQLQSAPELIARNGFVRVSDPCVGGGAMLIAAADAMKDAGINYQRHMFAIAQDLDITAVHMAYVQLSLMHVPALVYHGNSLAMEVRSTWRTLAYSIGGWAHKLARLRQIEDLDAFVSGPQSKGERPTAPPEPAPLVALAEHDRGRDQDQDQDQGQGRGEQIEAGQDARDVSETAVPVTRFVPTEQAQRFALDRKKLREQMQISLF